jgi:deoxyribodipyrimidine photo-lyase
MEINIFWFRRDLSLSDNHGLFKALKSGLSVIPIFIFDTKILEELPENDSRVSFIYDNLRKINDGLKKYKSSILILHGNIEESFQKLLNDYKVNAVYANEDYEPDAIKRDDWVHKYLQKRGISFNTFKNQVIYSKNEISQGGKKEGKPYTIFTPYKNAWLTKFRSEDKIEMYPSEKYLENFYQKEFRFPDLSEIGFTKGQFIVKDYNLSMIEGYDKNRNYPVIDATTYLGPHLRFGTISIRQLMSEYGFENEIFLNELIWREFFMQIMFHFPKSEQSNFKSKYDNIKWRNNEDEFLLWCEGKTGFPIIDAGMHQLNTTGYMHNRLRMITSSFLVKHLLIDWRWGEAYFAEKLLDYELASNVGNWQWAAGTGCDAAPYFRIFNPVIQQEKFDKNLEYILKFIPKYTSNKNKNPIVDHRFARERALETYKTALR